MAKSKLSQFKVHLEYDRTLKEIKKDLKRRTV